MDGDPDLGVSRLEIHVQVSRRWIQHQSAAADRLIDVTEGLELLDGLVVELLRGEPVEGAETL